MQKKKLNSVLLGGSNSVLLNGIASGLSKHSNLSNLSLGASSSLQNLYEIIRNKTIIENADIIISESNINDYHVNGMTDSLVPIDTVLENIDKLYLGLSQHRNKTIIILYPMCLELENKDLIYNRHLLNIDKFSLNYVDLHSIFINEGFISTLIEGPKDHPYSQMMSELGKLIIDKFDEVSFQPSVDECQSKHFKVWSPEHTEHKENSKFSEKLAVIYEKEQVHLPETLIGWNIIGAHCWNGDNPSKFDVLEGSSLMIETVNRRVIKPFNTECQFHDFHFPVEVTPQTTLSLTLDEITEKSIRARYSVGGSELKIIGLFLTKNIVKKVNYDKQKVGNRLQLFDGMITAVMQSIIQHNTYEHNKFIGLLENFSEELKEKNLDLANELIYKVHEFYPSDITVREMFIKLATSATQQKEWKKAKNLWHKVRSFFPNNPIGYTNGSMVCRYLGDYTEALSLINHSLKYHEITLFSLLQKGYALMKSSMLNDARNLWAKIRNDYPNNIAAYVQDAIACRRLGLFEEGLNLLNKSISIHKLKTEHLIQKAHLFMKLNQFKDASELWAEIRDNYPNNFDGYMQGAICLSELGGGGEAIKLFEMAAKNKPNLSAPLVRIAEILIKNKEFQAASNICKKLRLEFPKIPFGYTQGGICSRELGDIDGAVSVWSLYENKFTFVRISEVLNSKNLSDKTLQLGVEHLLKEKMTYNSSTALVDVVYRLYFSNLDAYEKLYSYLQTIESKLDELTKVSLGFGMPPSQILNEVYSSGSLEIIKKVFSSHSNHKTNVEYLRQNFDIIKHENFIIKDHFLNRYMVENEIKLNSPYKRLKVAVCISGQARGFELASHSWKNAFTNEHDFDLYCCLWSDMGRKGLVRAHLNRYFDENFCQVFLNDTEGMSQDSISSKYEALYSLFSESKQLEAEKVKAIYTPQKLDIVDSSDFKEESNMHCMHYMIERCWRLIDEPSEYDLIIRIRPDKSITDSKVNWNLIHEKCKEGYLIVDEPVSMHPSVGFVIGDQVAISTPEIMKEYSQTFSKVKMKKGIFKHYPGYRSHMSLALSMLENNVKASTASNHVKWGPLIDTVRLDDKEILEALTKDRGNGIPLDDFKTALMKK